MIAYANYTTTRRNLALLVRDWRLLIAPSSRVPRSGPAPGFPYAIDNGAWTAHVKGLPFDGEAFTGLLDRLAAAADFIVIPDIVAGGLASLAFSLSWRARGLSPM